jgi:integrase
VKTFRLKADAERFLRDIEHRKDRGAYHDPNAGRETFGDFWQRERAAAARTGRLSDRTLIAYDEIVRLYLSPLADHPLASVTPADVEDVLRSAPSATRAADIRKVLRAILGRAVRAGRIAANPATGVEVAKVERHEPRTLAAEELEGLVDQIPDRYRALVLVAAYSSLRWSELIALRVDRLDLVRDVIRVEEKITESGRLIHGAPKTERSRRAVTLPHTITLELAEHLRRYPAGADGRVFTAERGGVIRRPAFHRLVWKPATIAAGIPGFRFGQLRYTGATLALDAGANPMLVAFRLGHTSTRMLEQHYAGRLDRADRELARALDTAAQVLHERRAEDPGSDEKGR